MGMLCALSLVLVALIRFPLIPSASFLEYDAADIPVLIGTIMYGPISGLILLVIESGFQALIFSPQSGWFGFLMHVIASGMLILPVGIMYKIFKNRKSVAIGLIVGCVLMTLVMIPANLILNPIFYGTPKEVVKGLLWPAIIPFNLIKATINSVITFILYKPVMNLLKSLLISNFD